MDGVGPWGSSSEFFQIPIDNVRSMYSLRRSPFRVWFVLLSFMILALGGLWILGGRPTQISVEVHSALPSSILAERFEMHCRMLPHLNLRQVGGYIAPRESTSIRVQPIAISVPASANGIVMPCPIADIVLHAPPRQSDLDPAVVSCDVEFQAADQLKLEWYGRDERFIYLREYDEGHHARLVKLEPDQVEFVPNENPESEGCVVRYVVLMQHRGWERLYGKLFTKSCEESAKVRLVWICEQLESQR